jgi:hypothetical protein
MCHFTTIGHAIVAFFFIMIFENFTRGGEMNKVYGNLFFIQNILSIQNLWQETCFFAKNGQLLYLLGTREKNSLFQSMRSAFAKLFAHVLIVV